MIKNIRLLIVLSSFLFLSNSCKKSKNTDVEIILPILFVDRMPEEQEGVDSLIERVTYEFPTNLDDALIKNNTKKENIKSARLTNLRLQVVEHTYLDSTHYSNWKELSEIQLDIISSKVGREKVAFKLIPDVRTKAINMEIIDVELKSYLQQDKFAMAIRYRKRRPMYHDLEYVISGSFKIIAKAI